MTSSTVINGVTVGIAPQIGNFIYPTKVALQPDTTVVFVSLLVTLPSGGFVSSDTVRVCFANSQTSYATALDGCIALRGNQRYVETKLFPYLGKLKIERSSDGELVASGFEYLWLDVPQNSLGLTVSIILNELP